jgi:hypothetical protein
MTLRFALKYIRLVTGLFNVASLNSVQCSETQTCFKECEESPYEVNENSHPTGETRTRVFRSERKRGANLTSFQTFSDTNVSPHTLFVPCISTSLYPPNSVKEGDH